MDYIKKIFDDLKKENALQEFFMIPAQDREEIFYFNDRNQGLNQFFSSSGEIHRHQEGDKIYFSNENNEIFEVARTEVCIFKQRRLAQEETDFEVIYNREFWDSGLPDSIEAHLHFKENILPDKLQELERIHKKQAGKTKINSQITFLASRFLNYINPFIQNAPRQLTIKQVALLHAYNNLKVTRENANDIIKNHGHTSGQKFFQFYCEYINPTNRVSDPRSTNKIMQNKIKLFESVLDHLNKEGREKALKDLEELNNIWDAKY